VQVDSNSPKGDKLPERFRDHGWFVAFAPVENPQLAIVILGEHGGRGGSTYAPIARKIVEYYLKLSPTPAPQSPPWCNALSPATVAAASFVPQPTSTQ
jgi:penicillin-binding protein 2